MYKAFRSFDQFQKDTNFRAWIFKILLNTFISSYRKSVRQPHKVALEDIEDSFMYHVDKDSEMIMNEIQSGGYEEMFTDDVKRALDTIPYQFRVVIMLCDIEEFSYDEIANILEIPMGTVMSRLHRGRKLLRRKLRNYARNNGFVSSEALAEMEY
jgi:RNA polymerase sigma-70 factor (ECF subfamily)